jgi:hypothetical protein
MQNARVAKRMRVALPSFETLKEGHCCEKECTLNVKLMESYRAQYTRPGKTQKSGRELLQLLVHGAGNGGNLCATFITGLVGCGSQLLAEVRRTVPPAPERVHGLVGRSPVNRTPPAVEAAVCKLLKRLTSWDPEVRVTMQTYRTATLTEPAHRTRKPSPSR